MIIQEEIKKLIDDESQYGIYQGIEFYIQRLRQHLLSLPKTEAKRQTLSGLNWLSRKHLTSSLAFDLRLKKGDICFIDFGKAYINEAGYQHFGLILSLVNYKALVVPMSSNSTTISKASNVLCEGQVKNHLYYIGKLDGMNRPSVLFLNDAKYINTARVIEVIAHMDIHSTMFKEIESRILSHIKRYPYYNSHKAKG